MRKILILFVVAVSFFACNNKSGSRPQTALDTGRDFIRASLDGDFKTAEGLILNDTQNIQLFDRYKSFYNTLQQDQKQKYKDAEYTINKLVDVNDSTTTINYSNSYMHKPMDIKIVRVNNIWSVDFKYTYSGGE